MRKYLLGAAALILLASCGGNKFTVKGKLTNASDSNLYVIVPDTAGFKIQDTLLIAKDGSFSYEGTAKEETYLRFGNRGYTFDVLVKAGEDIELEGDANAIYEPYTVSGSEESSKLLELQKLYLAYRAQLQDLNDRYQEAIKDKMLNMDSLISKLDSTERTYAHAMMEKVKDFISANEESLASVIAFNYINPSEEMPFIEAYTEKLKQGPNAENSLASLFLKQVESMRKLKIGMQAPEISMPTPEDKIVTLSSLKGNYVLVDFWASWCKPCRAENPNVVKAYQQFKDKGLKILGVSLDKEKDAWKEAIAVDKLEWIQVSDLAFWDNKAAKDYRIEQIPTNFLLDKEGKIIAMDLRGENLFATLNKLFSAN